MRNLYVEVAGAVIALIALVFTVLAYLRTVGDNLDISEGRLGFQNYATKSWQLFDADSDPITSEQWNASDPNSRWIQVRLYNDGGEDVQLSALGLVHNVADEILFLGGDSQAYDVSDDVPPILHCADRANAGDFGECPEVLAPKRSIYARINLVPAVLREFTEDQRGETISVWVAIGSGDEFYDTDIALPSDAFG